MPDEKAKVGGKKAPPQPDEKPGHETAVAPFDDIIDAILGADPEAVREQRSGRMKRNAAAKKNRSIR